MGNTRIEFDDAEFTAGLARALKGLKLSSETALFEFGVAIVNEAKRIAPYDTGALKGSIQVFSKGKDSAGAYIDIGTIIEYASAVEYGTSNQRAQPYFRPAIQMTIAKWSRGAFKVRWG